MSITIGNFTFENPLFVGMGKYASYELMAQALEACGCEVVTVAVAGKECLMPAVAIFWTS